MSTLATIDLAHEAELVIGPLRVRPALREIVRADGTSEILEPRVMQVLVALLRAEGGILSRDDLTMSCWDGRVVGEDAITRVISRLRRLAETTGAGVFRIETITKVGYRLVPADAPASPARPSPPAAPPAPASSGPSRRAVIAGGAALAVGAGGALWFVRREPDLPPEATRLIAEARFSMREFSPEGVEQAIGLMRRAVEVAPNSAEAWGLLASAYAKAMHSRIGGAADEARIRAEAAITRSLSLDPDNPVAAEARGTLLPVRGRLLEVDRVFGAALKRHPDSDDLLLAYSGRLSHVGRCAEAAAHADRAVARARPAPGLVYTQALMRWMAGRVEEADRAIEQAHALFPLHFGVWFLRVYLRLYTGRAEDALAIVLDRERRPTGIPDDNFADLEQVVRAVAAKSAAATQSIAGLIRRMGRSGAGHAENAIQFSAHLGLVEDSFTIAEAYFFDRGYQIGERRFSNIQRTVTRTENRRTNILFMPSTVAMRADPRFERLVTELGLRDYWRRSGITPDYLRRA